MAPKRKIYMLNGKPYTINDIARMCNKSKTWVPKIMDLHAKGLVPTKDILDGTAVVFFSRKETKDRPKGRIETTEKA